MTDSNSEPEEKTLLATHHQPMTPDPPARRHLLTASRLHGFLETHPSNDRQITITSAPIIAVKKPSESDHQTPLDDDLPAANAPIAAAFPKFSEPSSKETFNTPGNAPLWHWVQPMAFRMSRTNNQRT